MTKIINEITPEHLAKLDQIDRNCIAMHVPTPPKTFINMQVHDKEGNLTLDYSMPSRSWVRNAYNRLASQMLELDGATVTGSATAYEAGSLKIKQQNATVYTYGEWLTGAQTYTTAAISNDTYGIIVGTGNTAESFEHYALAAKVANGTSAGQISYQAQDAPVGAYNSDTKKWTATITRIFNNNSGGSISVAEVGYVCQLYYAAAKDMLVCRDLLAEAVAVANGAQLTVTYTIEMTYPA